MAAIAAIGMRFNSGNGCLVPKNCHNLDKMLASYSSTFYPIIPNINSVAFKLMLTLWISILCSSFLADCSAVFKINREDR